MNWKKLLSNLLWIAALAFLVWFFLWPVSLTSAAPQDQGVVVQVLEKSSAGGTQTTYYLAAGTRGHEALRELLDRYPCRRTIAVSSKNTDQSFQWQQQILIRPEDGSAAIYTYGNDKLTLNESVLHNKAPEAFHQELLSLLQRDDLDIVLEETQVLSPEN